VYLFLLIKIMHIQVNYCPGAMIMATATV
jgi:hypothetical protein